MSASTASQPHGERQEGGSSMGGRGGREIQFRTSLLPIIERGVDQLFNVELLGQLRKQLCNALPLILELLHVGTQHKEEVC